ncbi:MAG: aminoglycoside phosphotransferase family protein [Desulfocapsaceae bacterium]|nr:aminoglycoside phosphotransferase family protein [Desulfocapsaceae bacterium]
MVREDLIIPAEVVTAFLGQQKDVVWSTLGQGNINDTFLVRYGDRALVLQRINEFVFPDPVIVAENAAVISAYITGKLAGQTEVYFPAAVQTTQGDTYFRDQGGGVWKAQRYLSDTHVLKAVQSGDQAYEIGRCLGRFHALVNDLSPAMLGSALPHFHDLPTYLEKFDAALQNSLSDDGASVGFCLNYIDENRKRATFFEDARRRGDVQTRVIHGDPKVANVLFDGQNSTALTLIDCDTVGPGLVLQDLGDCLRSCCSQTGEDAYDAVVHCNADFAAHVVAGYASENELSSFEKANLHTAFYLITFELGLRFFTDYLQGNPYFKVQQSDDNLKRAMVQFKLAESIDNQQGILVERFASACE